jgi:ABC-type lipoprotein export system ATPase subunit
MLELINIIKSYKKGIEKIEVLDGVNFVLKTGEFVAIQGASGCGKTTLLLISGGLLHPDQGLVKVNGKNFYSENSEARASFRAKNFGFVFQQYHLVPYLTTYENILLPALAFNTKNEVKKSNELMEFLGLTERADHLPAELSAGEKQRIALARAFLHSPKVIFADEITGNLDEENSRIVIDALISYKNQGGAVLFVTHDSDKARAADKILRIENKHLV